MAELRGKIKLWDACNNNCVFCSTDSKSSNQTMTLEQVKAKIDDIENNQSEELLLFGGEPTILPYFFQILDYAKTKNFRRVCIQSNGRALFYELFAKKAASYDFEWIISIHGHTPELHNLLTNTKSFDQTLRGIRNLIKFGQKVSSNTVITKYNTPYLKVIAEMLVSEGVHTVQFALMHPFGRAQTNFKALAEHISMIMPNLFQAIDVCEKVQKNVYVEGFPLCVLGKYKDKATEIELIKNINSYGKEYLILDYRQWLKDHKTKEECCMQCKYNLACEGYFKEYGFYDLITIVPKK